MRIKECFFYKLFLLLYLFLVLSGCRHENRFYFVVFSTIKHFTKNFCLQLLSKYYASSSIRIKILKRKKKWIFAHNFCPKIFILCVRQQCIWQLVHVTQSIDSSFNENIADVSPSKGLILYHLCLQQKMKAKGAEGGFPYYPSTSSSFYGYKRCELITKVGA